MPVPVFSVGETLTSAAMNAVGLWRVTGCTVSSVGGTAATASNGVITIGNGNTSVTVNDAFSANFDNYKITVSGGGGTQAGIRMTLGATATGYYAHTVYNVYTTNTVTGFGPGNSASWTNAGYSSTNGLSLNMEIFQPFDTKRTWMMSANAGILTTEAFYRTGGFLDNDTSYTSFTLTIASGSFTGGTIRVYGYRD